MNLEEYIASGVLELYIAGLLSESEVQELQRMIQQYPELELEIARIEEALEDYATYTSGKLPGYDLIQGVMAKVEEEQSSHASNGKSAQVITQKRPTRQERKPKANAPGKEKRPTTEEPSFFSSRLYGIAASVLLLISLATNIYLFQREQRLNKVMNTLMRNNHELKSDMEAQESRLAIYENTTFQPIFLEGTQLANEASAFIYWNQESQELFLKVNQLPAPNADKQYQLWALQSGTPVSLGVFDVVDTLQSMGSLQGTTQAFAVTLEPTGGRERPSLDQMYLMGNVGS